MARAENGQSEQIFFRGVAIAHGFANVVSWFTQCSHGTRQRIFPCSRRFGGGRYCKWLPVLNKLRMRSLPPNAVNVTQEDRIRHLDAVFDQSLVDVLQSVAHLQGGCDFRVQAAEECHF
jgi:hypothetical protein